MKYRIIKISTGDKIHYEIQKLTLLFFWITETYFDCCVDGLMAGNYPIEFEDIDKAKNYIHNQNIKNEVICVM